MSDSDFYCFSREIDESARYEGIGTRAEGEAGLDADDPSASPKSPPRLDESLQPCVCCGKPSVNRWCSTSCFISEDGYEPEDWK